MTVFLGICITIVVLIFVRHYVRRKNDPPGPLGLPGMGTLVSAIFTKIFGLTKPRLKEQQDQMKKYGPIWSAEVGLLKLVFLGSYDVVREAMTMDNGDRFSGRPCTPYHLYLSKGCGVLAIDGEKWVEHRRFILRVLKDFGMGKGSMRDRIWEEVDFLGELITARVGQPVDMSEIFVKAVSNVISVLVFGQRWGYEDDNFLEYVGYIKTITHSSGIGAFLPLFYPCLARPTVMKCIPSCREFIRQYEKIHEIIDEKIDAIKARHNLKDEPTNMIEAYLCEKHRCEEIQVAHTFDKTQIIKVCFEMFAAGTDTTTNALTWSLLMLSLYPEIQTKVHEEIDRVIGNDKRPDTSDRMTLPYTQAVMDEILRYCTIVPRAIDKRVMHTTRFRGYTFTPDTIIMTHVYLVHRDPKLWSRPEEFYPAHFLSEDGSYRPSEYLIPFGLGKRKCLGESLAQMEFFIFLVYFLQRYSVTLDDSSREQIDDILAGTDGIIHAPKLHKIIFQHRI